MKIKVDEIQTQDDVEIIIRCPHKNEEIDRLVDVINAQFISILGKLDGEQVVIKLSDIYYFEAVENHVFAYTAQAVYEISYKIQELCELLLRTSFTQISRTIILSVNKIKKVHPLVNGRIMAVLDNGEKIIITRFYASSFKNKLREQVKK